MEESQKHYTDADIARIDERGKSNSHRIDDLTKKQEALNELTSSVKVLATNQKNMESDVKEIKEDVKNITGKAGRRWDGLVDKALAVLIGAFIAWVLAGGAM